MAGTRINTTLIDTTLIDTTPRARGRRRPGQGQEPGLRPGRPADGSLRTGPPRPSPPARRPARPDRRDGQSDLPGNVRQPRVGVRRPGREGSPAAPGRVGSVRAESARRAPARSAQARSAPARATSTRTESVRTEPVRTEPVRTEPVRTTSARTTPHRSAAQRMAAERAERAWASGTLGLPRMSFVLLVLALLGGGLICLLVINTTLGATSFRITQLQSINASLSEQDQALQQTIASSEAPGQIAHRAYALGMRWQSQLNYLDPATGRIYRVGARGPGTVLPLVPTSHVTSERAATGNGRSGKKGSPASKAGGTATARRSAPGSAGTTRSGLRHGGRRRLRTKTRARSAA